MEHADAVRMAGLTKRFGALPAVDGLTLSVRQGELFGLVGPDGAGKTTTLRLLAGVMRPTSGDAWIFGRSVARDPDGVKHETAYMSQRFGLYTDLTVRQNLDFYADLYGVPRSARPERIERLFAFSNLEPFQNRLAGHLSGGMKQKLGLSCALIHQPRLLLLDEPTFGVDPVSRRDLWLIVHEMVAQGVTCIVSTAYMDEAERFDRVALLHRGRALAMDAPGALQEGMPGQILALQVDDVRRAAAALQDHPAVRRVTVFGDHLHLTVADAGRDGPLIASHLHGGGVTGVEIHAAAPSMEDVFIDHVARAEGQ